MIHNKLDQRVFRFKKGTIVLGDTRPDDWVDGMNGLRIDRAVKVRVGRQRKLGFECQCLYNHPDGRRCENKKIVLAENLLGRARRTWSTGCGEHTKPDAGYASGNRRGRVLRDYRKVMSTPEGRQREALVKARQRDIWARTTTRVPRA